MLRIHRYCRTCLVYAVDPSNPRPPRKPLVATTSAAFTKHKNGQNGQAKRSARTKADGEPDSKRARNGSSRAESVVDGGDDAKSESAAPASAPRPKRRAAENAPDYYAWNHGIAAPTTKWLQLIADPEKYGKVILDGEPARHERVYERAEQDNSRLPLDIRFDIDEGMARLGSRAVSPGRAVTVLIPWSKSPTYDHPPVGRRL